MADKDSDITGVSDVTYGVISVLYHTLQGIDVAEAYLEDAEDADDEEVTQFLRELMAVDRQRVAKAKALLLARLAKDGSAAEDDEDEDEEDNG